MADELLNFLNDINSLALKKGATAADSVIVDSDGKSLGIRKGKLEKYETYKNKSFGIRVFVNQKQSVVSSSDFSKKAVERIVEQVVSMAKSAVDDPHIGLADKTSLAKYRGDLHLYDSTDISYDQMFRIVNEAEQAAFAFPQITNSEGAEFNQTKTSTAIAATNGFSGSFKASGFSLSATVIAASDQGMEVDYDYSHKCHYADLTKPEEIGKEAAARAIKKLNPRKIQTTHASVVYPPRVAGGLIAEFLGAINGSQIAKKASFLKDQLGNQVFDSGISIVDNPHLMRGIKSRYFDAEGLMGVERDLVLDGVLESWILDIRTANQLGMKSTGHASRGIASSPYPSCTNVHVKPSEFTPEQLISSIKKGLLITDLFGGGVNLLTGDYSQGAAGIWIEDGEPKYAVSEITVASNLMDIYKCMKVANDLELKYSINSPTLVVENMTIAGL